MAKVTINHAWGRHDEVTIDCGDDLGYHRVPLLGVDEVGEENGVPDEGECCLFFHNMLLLKLDLKAFSPDEEDGGVVAHNVPVALLCVELHCKPTRVPVGEDTVLYCIIFFGTVFCDPYIRMMMFGTVLCDF